jgi:hypothetical protein
MHRHRFLEQLNRLPLPQPQAHPIPTSAFCACPLSLMAGLSVATMQWRQRIYQLAFEEAKAVVRPSLPERDLLGVWN